MPHIQKITVKPKTARPAEPVEISVLYSNSSTTQARVTIDGIEGDKRVVQFRTTGTKQLRIRAWDGDEAEEVIAVVEVAGEPIEFTNGPRQELAILNVQQSLTDPYRVTFFLGEVPVVRGGHSTNATAPLVPVSLGKMAEVKSILPEDISESITTGSVRSARIGLRSTLLKGRSYTEAVVADLGSVYDTFPEPKSKVRYDWNFGDGHTATTSSPRVTHDFLHAIGADLLRYDFTVRCRAVHDDVELARTLVFYSAYGLCKSRGALVPPVRSNILAGKAGIFYTAPMTITNLEAVPLQITHRAIVSHGSDGDALDIPKFKTVSGGLQLPPNSVTQVTVYALQDVDVLRGSTSFTVYHAGTTSEGMPVRATAVFDIPVALRRSAQSPLRIKPPVQLRPPWPWEEVETIADDLRMKIPQVGKNAQLTLAHEAGHVAVSVSRTAAKDLAVLHAMAQVGDAGKLAILKSSTKRISP